jgi:hypothetical protein
VHHVTSKSFNKKLPSNLVSDFCVCAGLTVQMLIWFEAATGLWVSATCARQDTLTSICCQVPEIGKDVAYFKVLPQHDSD